MPDGLGASEPVRLRSLRTAWTLIGLAVLAPFAGGALYRRNLNEMPGACDRGCDPSVGDGDIIGVAVLVAVGVLSATAIWFALDTRKAKARLSAEERPAFVGEVGAPIGCAAVMLLAVLITIPFVVLANLS